MAEKDRRELVEVDTAGTEAGAGAGRSAERAEGGNTEAARKEGTAAGTAGTAGAGTAGKAEEKSPQVVTVNVPTEKKPKRKPKAKKDTKEQSASPELIRDLIVAGSQMVAMMPDMAHWEISSEEAQTIAAPLVKVIEKNDSLKKVVEQSDNIALAVAAMTVFAPRAYITVMQMQEKQKRKKERAAYENSTARTSGEGAGSAGKDVGRDAAANKNPIPPLYTEFDL